MSPAAASSSVRNCCSVALMAASAMLLTRPMCRKVRGFSLAPGCTRGHLRPDRRSGPRYFGFKKTGMANSSLGSRGERRSRLQCHIQGLIEIGQDVVDMFDPDAQADHLRQNASVALLLGRHLPMRG